MLRLVVRPHEILDETVSDANVPVRRRALVGTAGLRRARLEQLHAHVFDREIPARGQRSLEQADGAHALCEHLAVEEHADAAARRVHVDPVERIACMTEQELVFGEPFVHPIPVERDVSREK